MSKAFSVSVNIGGKLSPSLAGAVRAANSQIARLGAHVGRANLAMSRAVVDAGRSINAAGRQLRETGRSVTAGISAPTGLLAFSAGKAAFEFEKAGNLLQALGDASDEQRAKFEGLANHLNKKYPQSLAEIIRTGNEMLKGGFNFDQMLGSIDQTLATAVLGDMTPSEVGNMMARTINAFQMPMNTYEQAMRSSQQVSDRMTYAAVKTTASLKDMGEMFRYVGGAMSATGGGLDEATAFGMLFAKNGTVGSEAGVALRSAIVRMVKMPDKGLVAMNRIGMNLNNYVGGKQALTSDRILGGLQAGGIDAAPIKGEIDKILKNRKIAGSPAALQNAITKAVQSHLGSSSAIDATSIAENVNDSITAAGSQINLVGFFRDLKAKIESGQATMGDVASILEGRHFSRYVPILQGDLDATIKAIQGESNGYTQSRHGIVLKGPVGAIYEVGAALEKLSSALGRIAFPQLAAAFSAFADSVQRVAEENPKLLKFATVAGLLAISLGPLIWALGALNPLTLALAAAGKWVYANWEGLGTAFEAFGQAFHKAIGPDLGNKLSELKTWVLDLLGPVDNMHMSFAKWGVEAGRAAGEALVHLNRFSEWFNTRPDWGSVFSGLAESIYSVNWEAIGVNFGQWLYDAFSSGAQSVNWGSLLSGIWSLIDASVGLIGGLVIGTFQGLGQRGYDALAAFDWGGLGAAIVNGIIAGIQSLAGAFVDALTGLAAAGAAKVKSLFSVNGAVTSMPPTIGSAHQLPKSPSGPAIAGARARGGPVIGGKTYLVGEEGPELFTAERTGRIVPNDRLQSLARGSGGGGSRAPIHIEVNVHGGGDAREAARLVREELQRLMWRMESDQRALLSD